jgi:EAL domain-containing protein (putative c-di-GMP-specific phosphodiesterase class I)
LLGLLRAAPLDSGHWPERFLAVAENVSGLIDEENLRSAIASDQLHVVYQPEIRCRDHALAGVEALVRWVHPEHGDISPATFIPLAESWGLIEPVTELVFDQSLNWLASHPGHGNFSLSINLSAICFADIRLPDRLAAKCQKIGVNPARIVLEITETAAMADPATTLALTTRLRLKGFRLSIDDFGVGYSSLVQLARIPFSELKIDTSFVRDMARSLEARKIVVAIINLGRSLGLCVNAEGVENAETLSLLCAAQCDQAQGFYIGQPMPGHQFQAWRPPATPIEKI